MKLRHIILFVAILALSACAQAAKPEQAANTAAPIDPAGTAVVTQAEATNKIEAICFRNSEETQLLMNFAQGYCLQYPAGYDIALESEMDIMLV
jgi:hypothetical protein